MHEMQRIITKDVERRDDVKRRKITQKINRIIYDKKYKHRFSFRNFAIKENIKNIFLKILFMII